MSGDQERATDLINEANELHNAGDKLSAAPMYLAAAQMFGPFASFALVAGDSYAEAGHDDRASEAYEIVLADMADHDQALAGVKAAKKRLKKAGQGGGADGPVGKSGFFRRRGR